MDYISPFGINPKRDSKVRAIVQMSLLEILKWINLHYLS
jgi:hypothetical protein